MANRINKQEWDCAHRWAQTRCGHDMMDLAVQYKLPHEFFQKIDKYYLTACRRALHEYIKRTYGGNQS